MIYRNHPIATLVRPFTKIQTWAQPRTQNVDPAVINLHVSDHLKEMIHVTSFTSISKMLSMLSGSFLQDAGGTGRCLYATVIVIP